MVLDQGLGIVQQQLAWQAAEMAKRSLDALKPRRLSLVLKRLDINPPRVAERRHEQVYLASAVILHLDPALAKVDLQLAARRRLIPHCR